MPRYRTTANRLLRAPRRKYSLFDSFSVDAAAGSVNGTLSDKSRSLRTVTDTNNKISVASGVLDFATGAAANDGLWSPLEARRLGTVFHAKVTPSNTDGIINVGWDANTSGAILDALQFAAAGALQIIANGSTAVVVGAYTATAYEVVAIMRATGVYWYIKGGAFTYWTALRPTALGTAAAYPAITAGSATSIFTADDARVARRIYVPTPIAYDAFTRANGALGVSDIVGPDSQAVVSRAWSFPAGTWAISTNKAVGTPGMGANGLGVWDFTSGWSKRTGSEVIVDSNTFTTDGAGGLYTTAGPLTVGVWYQHTLAATTASGTLRSCNAATNVNPIIDGAGSASFRAIDTSFYLRVSVASADVSVTTLDVLPLTLASLFASVTDARTADVMVDVKVAALTAGTQAGVAIRLNSASAPTVGIVAYFNGAGNIVLDEFTAAATWTNLIAAVAKAFTAADTLRIWATGTAIRLYHIVEATGAATLIGTATATANVNTLHGMFSTYSGNTFTSIHITPTGMLDGAHEALSRL